MNKEEVEDDDDDEGCEIVDDKFYLSKIDKIYFEKIKKSLDGFMKNSGYIYNKPVFELV